MKFSLSRLLALVATCLMLTFTGISAAQEVSPGVSTSINLDDELDQTGPNRAASYYHFSRAKSFEDKGDLSTAFSEMRKALRYNQTSPAVHLAMASLLEKSGDTRQAIEYAKEAARLDPKDPGPHWLLFNMYYKQQERSGVASQNPELALKELETLKGLTPNDPQVHHLLGGAYFAAKQPDKAIESFEKFQSLSANSDAGYREIAKHYRNVGNDEKAAEYLEKALQVNPDSTETLVLLSNLYTKLGKNKEAIPILVKLRAAMGDNPDVSRELASTLLDANQPGEALKILEEIEKKNPGDKAVQLIRGKALLAMRRYSESTKTLETFLASTPGNMEAEYFLACAYEASGKLEQAVPIFERLFGNDSEEARNNRERFRLHLVKNYMELKAYDKAVPHLQAITTAEPKKLHMLVDVYRLSRQYDKALSLAKQEYGKDPGNLDIGIVYARTLVDSGDKPAGIQMLNKLIESNPQAIDLYAGLVQIFLKERNYSEAEKTLLRARKDAKLDQDASEWITFQLASVYERQRDFDRAELLFREILKTNPNNHEVLNYLGYMLADRGIRLDEAVDYVKAALAMNPESGAYLDSLGWAFFKKNDLANAEKYLLEANARVNDDPTIVEHLGDLYVRTGDLKKAKQFYTTSLTIGKKDGIEEKEIEKVQRKLEDLEKTIRRNPSR